MTQVSSKEHNYYIYAVYGFDDYDQRNVVYIGSTSSKRPYPRLQAHLHGEVFSTDAYFGPDAACSSPHCKILEAVRCTKSMEYKHCLAWGCFFEEHGYHLIGDYVTSCACRNLFPPAQSLYKEICEPYTLEEVLRRPDPTFPPVPLSSEADNLPEEDPPSQVNIRLKASVRQRFRRYCDEFPGTQSEALDTLLHLQESSGDVQAALFQTSETMQQMKETITAQKQQIEHLTHLLKDEKALVSARKRMELQTLRSTISILCGQLLPPPPDTKPLPIKKASAFSPREAYEYQYPKSPGAAIVTFEKLFWGKPSRSILRGIWGRDRAPLFVLARTTDGEPLKLRWFRREEYLGKAPDSCFAVEGSFWLVGYLPTTNGKNTDLVAGIPLRNPRLIPTAPDSPSPEVRHPSLDDMLAEIQNRKP